MEHHVADLWSCHIYLDDPRIAENAHILTFAKDEVVVTIRIVLNDEQSGADLAITNMTTLPYSKVGNGYGSAALQILLAFAKQWDMRRIIAVQVQCRSETFWTNNAFVPRRNVTNDYVLIWKKTKGPLKWPFLCINNHMFHVQHPIW